MYMYIIYVYPSLLLFSSLLFSSSFSFFFSFLLFLGPPFLSFLSVCLSVYLCCSFRFRFRSPRGSHVAPADVASAGCSAQSHLIFVSRRAPTQCRGTSDVADVTWQLLSHAPFLLLLSLTPP